MALTDNEPKESTLTNVGLVGCKQKIKSWKDHGKATTTTITNPTTITTTNLLNFYAAGLIVANN